MSSPVPAAGAQPPAGLISVDEAREFVLARARAIADRETVPIAASLGRVLARAERAPIDVPGHDNSAMDGYAVRSADIAAGGGTRLRVVQRIAAGGVGRTLGAGEAARIFTGAPMPPGADAVAIQEDCERDGDAVLVRVPVSAGEWVRPRGNDIRAGTEILAPGVRVRPQEMGLAASIGLDRVTVVRRPRVAIFSTGDELLDPGDAPVPGRIYNSNRFTVAGLLGALGCEVLDLGTVADTLEATVAMLRDAGAHADAVVTSGGVSVGEEDHVRRALERAGRVELWNVAVKPGKPLLYGRVGEADVLGLPGNPVSTLVTFCLFVRPFLLRRLGVADPIPRPLPATAAFEWPRPGTRREFARARLVDGPDGPDGFPAVEIYPKQGSDVLTSAAWADGLVEIREGETVRPGDRVRFHPFAALLG